MPPFLFIVGRGRSGTTLLRAMFDSHPQMAIPDESHFIVPMGRQRRVYESPAGFATNLFVRDLTRNPHFQRWGLPEEEVVNALAAAPEDFPNAMRAVFAAYARYRGKNRYGDKTPRNLAHIGFLATLFPESRFIHIIRDGRDVALSYMSVEFGPKNVWENAIYWKRNVTVGRKAGWKLGPQRYQEVRYEELIEDPEGHLRRLCPFTGLEFDERILRYFERAEHIVGSRSHHRHISEAPTKGLRDWRQQMAQPDIELFEALAGDLLTDLGYERAVPVVPLRAGLLARRRWLDLQVVRVRRALFMALRTILRKKKRTAR